VRRVVADLSLPVRIVGCPIVRDPDGLAMSSRNRHLSPAAREAALALPRALAAAASGVESGRLTDGDTLEQEAFASLRDAGLEPEYVRAVDPESFTSVQELDGAVLIVGAARVEDVRLIDNLPAASAAPRRTRVPTAQAVTA
jgi:pantoate--beta-alanine ligase